MRSSAGVSPSSRTTTPPRSRYRSGLLTEFPDHALVATSTGTRPTTRGSLSGVVDTGGPPAAMPLDGSRQLVPGLSRLRTGCGRTTPVASAERAGLARTDPACRPSSSLGRWGNGIDLGARTRGVDDDPPLGAPRTYLPVTFS